MLLLLRCTRHDSVSLNPKKGAGQERGEKMRTSAVEKEKRTRKENAGRAHAFPWKRQWWRRREKNRASLFPSPSESRRLERESERRKKTRREKGPRSSGGAEKKKARRGVGVCRGAGLPSPLPPPLSLLGAGRQGVWGRESRQGRRREKERPRGKKKESVSEVVHGEGITEVLCTSPSLPPTHPALPSLSIFFSFFSALC